MPTIAKGLSRSFAAVFAVAAASGLTAQCSNYWQPSLGCPGANGWTSSAVAWDPDGAGPAPQVVAIGGGFDLFGNVSCSGLATWDPVTGTVASVPPPLPFVHALTTAPNGDLVASVAGHVGGLPQWQVAIRGASGWTSLAPFASQVSGVLVRPNGEIVAAGNLLLPGGVNLGAFARWSGTAWVPLGGGVPGFATSMVLLANGDAVLSAVDLSGPSPVWTLHQWNGTTLTPMPGPGGDPYGQLVVAANGIVFTVAGNSLWSWNGSTWTNHVPPSWLIAGGLTGAVCFDSNGDLLLVASTNWPATASFTVRYAPASGGWSQLPGQFAATISSLASLPGGTLLALGAYENIDGRSVANLARFDGAVWQALFDGTPGATYCVSPLADDRFAIGGAFTSCGSLAADHVAQWTGTSWAAMGAGLDNRVRDLQQLPNGDLLAGGDFTASGTVTARALARWDGVVWSEFAGGMGALSRVDSIAVAPNGDVVVVGTFTHAGGVLAANIARWNGTTWSPLGGGLGSNAQRVAIAPNGDVWVLVDYDQILRWNGSAWTTMLAAPGNAFLYDLEVLPNGKVVTGGSVAAGAPAPQQAHVAVFDPQSGTWSTVTGSEGFITSVVATPSGDALLFGVFSQLGGVPLANAARLAGGGFPVAFAPGGSIGDAAFAPDGNLLVSGWLTGGQYAVGRITSTCPAIATPSGAGCIGSGGQNVLAVEALPWLGSAFRSVATGMATGLAVGVHGLGPTSIPLPAILPQGLAGCTLQVTPDLLLAFVPTAGVVHAALTIPDQPTFLGQTLHQQFVSLEIAGGITAATSTNALTVTIGEF